MEELLIEKDNLKSILNKYDEYLENTKLEYKTVYKLHANKEEAEKAIKLIDGVFEAEGFSKSAKGEVETRFTSSDDAEFRSGSLLYLIPKAIEKEKTRREEAAKQAAAEKANKQ